MKITDGILDVLIAEITERNRIYLNAIRGSEEEVYNDGFCDGIIYVLNELGIKGRFNDKGEFILKNDFN